MEANFNFGSFSAVNMRPTDTELTNLNWVAGAPVPMQHPVSPTRKGAAVRSKHSQREEAKTTYGAGTKNWKQTCSQTPIQREGSCSDTHCNGTSAAPPQNLKKETARKDKGRDGKGSGGSKSKKEKECDAEEATGKKPNCSYTSLIGLALMASEGGCLPVSEIYTYIEEEFPYFKSAPDGWKNSIRHNLSLNPAFRKVEHSIKWQGKKGFFWEVTPERRTSVEREVERYLRQEGKLTQMEHIDGSAPFPSYLHASIPTMPQVPSMSGGSLRPMCEFQFCTGTQPYYDIVSSMQRHYPPPPSSLSPSYPLPPTPASSSTHSATPVIPPTTAAMITLLDTDMSPSQFAGFSDPTTSTTTSALHDLFGLQLSPPKRPSGPQHTTHVYTQPPAHTYVVDSCGILSPYASPCVCNSSGALPEWPNCRTSKRRNMRLRKQALDQVIIPEEQSIASVTDPTAIGSNSRFYLDSGLLNHCTGLEECFVMGGNEDAFSDAGTLFDYSGELPLPPSAHARMGREEVRTAGMSMTKGRGEKRGIEKLPQSTTKVMDEIEEVSEISLMGLSDAMGAWCSRKDKRGRRKRRRVSAHRRTTQREAKSSNCQGEAECAMDEHKIEGQGDVVLQETEEGQDMLSTVYSDSEEAVRKSLFTATCTVLGCGGGGTSCTVDDGLYSPPDATCETVIIPISYNQVY